MTQIIVQLNPDVPPTGNDLSIVNAARKSFGKRSEWFYSGVDTNGPPEKLLKKEDKRLLEFLARGMTADDFEEYLLELFHSNTCQDFEEVKELVWKFRNTPTHDTPFNHGFFSFEVKAPIFVRAQLVKHEYLIMSEYSRRYITDDIEFYEPEYWRKASKDKKQGSLDEPVKTSDGGNYGSGSYFDFKSHTVTLYEEMLKAGVAPEQARMVLPQSLMTSWTWSGTLGAFANMCKLRCHPEAQKESKIVADQVYEYLKQQFPVSARLLVEGVL